MRGTPKMPFLQLITNLPLEKSVANKLAVDLSKVASDVLGKPEHVMSVQIKGDEVLTFAGSTDPCSAQDSWRCLTDRFPDVDYEL